jgi:hypothetical protein
MTHFEYISVALSLIFALVLSRLLGALPSVLQPDRRYWVHAVWVFNMLGLAAVSWWATWGARNDSWIALTFVLQLAIPGIMYVRSTILVTAQPGEVASWRAHFYESRVRFFGVAILGCANGIATPLAKGHPWSDDAVVVPAFFAIGAIVGIASAREWVHAALAVLSSISILGALFFSNMARF